MKSKKDVLLLCQFFYPEYNSSATLPFDTAVAFSRAGFSVGVICGYPKEYCLKGNVPKKEVYENISINRLKYIQLQRTNFIGRIVNYFSFAFSVVINIRCLSKYKVVLVYSNPPILPITAVLAAIFFKIKVIFVSYDVYPEVALTTNMISEYGIISWFMKAANKIIFKRVNKVVALSNEMKTYLLKNRSLLSQDHVEVIPNWYEDRWKQDKSVALRNEQFSELISEDNFIVSYFGNMGICQDLDTILDAIRRLKNDNKIKFLFAGHGNKMPKLKEIVKEERLENVTVLDFLHGQDYEDALSISDCFLVSLEERLTGLCVPSKTYSYMMAGKPIIAIMGENCDIVRDLRKNNAGFALKGGEGSKLVSVIKKLQYNHDEREIIGKNCRRLFLKKYTKECCTQQYITMIRKVMED